MRLIGTIRMFCCDVITDLFISATSCTHVYSRSIAKTFELMTQHAISYPVEIQKVHDKAAH